MIRQMWVGRQKTPNAAGKSALSSSDLPKYGHTCLASSWASMGDATQSEAACHAVLGVALYVMQALTNGQAHVDVIGVVRSRQAW